MGKAKRGREPKVWFDKACINQKDIAEDLRGLPIFLAGCKELLVLCGKTYLSRLWCVVELFTFVHMGGDPDRIAILNVLSPDNEMADLACIRSCVQRFDASNCDCFDPTDKEKMIQIIRTSFGDLSNF